MQSPIVEFPLCSWQAPIEPALRQKAQETLESGGVLYFPHLGFDLRDEEKRFLAPVWSDGRAKNIYLRGRERSLRGFAGSEDDALALMALIERYSSAVRHFLDELLPSYAGSGELSNTSFRPVEAAGRAQSWRHDDSRLHTDAFPSKPTHGTRILRVFCNINSEGRPRQWRVGESFADMARRFLPRLPPYHPWLAGAMHKLGITKSRRSEYDHLMLHLHDAQKADTNYQETAPQVDMPFPPGSTWICFSDQVLHAVMGGQYLLEQTLHVPVAALSEPGRSPLRILEKMLGRPLVEAP